MCRKNKPNNNNNNDNCGSGDRERCTVSAVFVGLLQRSRKTHRNTNNNDCRDFLTFSTSTIPSVRQGFKDFQISLHAFLGILSGRYLYVAESLEGTVHCGTESCFSSLHVSYADDYDSWVVWAGKQTDAPHCDCNSLFGSSMQFGGSPFFLWNKVSWTKTATFSRPKPRKAKFFRLRSSVCTTFTPMYVKSVWIHRGLCSV